MPTFRLVNFRPLPAIVILRRAAGILAVLAAALLAAAPAAAYSIIHSHATGPGHPRAGLIADASGNLYGTTQTGGATNGATIFKVRTDGTGFSVLHSFTGAESAAGWRGASLIVDASGNLYGTATYGGTSRSGSVFTMKTDGTGFSVLHNFGGGGGAGGGLYPRASLILDSSGVLYGTSLMGGVSDSGTVFRVRTDGTEFSVLHSFAGGAGDGVYPEASLILDAAGNLYGTTTYGGSSNGGSVFRIKTDGTGFAVLHSFAGGTGDGQNPYVSLVLDASGNLYGTTESGGAFDNGTVFRLRTDGTGFSVLHSFAGGTGDGQNPYAPLILDASGNLYGTTTIGGMYGTVFAIRTDGTGFSILHSFAGGAGDGRNPWDSLILDDAGNLFGTSERGGASNIGTVFTIRTDGTAFSVLHSFPWSAGDGQNPYASLIVDASGNLYGTTVEGGASDVGTVFTIRTDGTGFSILHSFAEAVGDGQTPRSLLLDTSGNLYGTTVNGGASHGGTVFTIRTDGTGFSVLHSFAGGAGDGQFPYASLILDASGMLYGTTYGGGASSLGTVFTIRTDGTGFSVLHSFAGGAADGRSPGASLVLDAPGNLYGTTHYGGLSDVGTVFTVKTDGTGFSVLHSFAGGTGDGQEPHAALILDGSLSLYGTTLHGGALNRGTVFKIKTDGTGFTVLHSFAGGTAGGWNPWASLILDASGNLYGTTSQGGAAGKGTVFTIRSDGTGFSLLHSFAGGAVDGRSPYAPLILDPYGTLYGTTPFGGAWDSGTEFTLPSLCVPGAPTGGPASRCGPGTVTLSASGALAGQDHKWYDAPTGGTLLQTGGASFTTPPISTTTTFYVSVFDTTTLCESGRMAVRATVNAIPAAPTAGSEPTVCQGESIHLTASTVPGATYSWTGPDGFVSASQNPVITNVQPAAGGTYGVTVTVDGCESALGTTSTTVNPDTTAPTVAAPADVVVFQSLCCGTFGGASSDTSPALATFLSGGSAVDDCVATATALAPQAGGSDVTGTTCFEVGTTTVTFRYSDAAGNVGTDTANVTVRMYGDLNVDAAVDPADMVVLQSYFNSAATPEVPPFGAPEAMADLTHDTLVDPADMVQLQAYFNFAVSCLAP